MDSVIKKIVEETPNDMEVGEKIREMYWKNRELEKQYMYQMSRQQVFTSMILNYCLEF